jgi:hypothetical protein
LPNETGFDSVRNEKIMKFVKGVTPEQITLKVGKSKSNISRLESLNNTYMPNLGT